MRTEIGRHAHQAGQIVLRELDAQVVAPVAIDLVVIAPWVNGPKELDLMGIVRVDLESATEEEVRAEAPTLQVQLVAHGERARL